ncbi:MAG: acetyl-CoA carboxylase biotin carboxyl carrier protein [Deltaproteobacteria bacterium]|nr:acetyl-CoA carboxylase biotin carboxyl carrier protein [Deltaproteobacteria bacterium]
MDIKKIKQIVKLLKENDLQEIEIEDDESRIMVKNGGGQSFVAAPQPLVATQAVPVEGNGPAKVDETKAESKYHVVKSPMVGTFYRSPSPDSPAYVEEGQTVTKGQSLCIVEAMKLMNEIEADVKGKIVTILVENGQPVEYGEPLLEIDVA